ncbi:MAG: Ig-like domain-containing protein [Pirellulales bacterium]|nr:Ig-like domain-containing protein [Pirellulales bacterium]
MATMRDKVGAKCTSALGAFVLIVFMVLSTVLPAISRADPPEVKTQPDAQTLLLVRTTPSGAEIRLDGEKMGLSGQLLSVKPGRYKLVVDMSGHEPIEQEITIRDGRITRIELDFDGAGALSADETAKRVKEAVRIISTCAEGNPRVKKAIESLKRLDEAAVVAALNEDLSSETNTIRRASIYVAWQGGFKSIEPVVPELLKLCNHAEEFTRGMAALALGANRVATSYSRLVDMVENDKSGYARRCAAYALGELGNRDATAVLQAALKDSDRLVRNNAEAALTMLGTAASSTPGVAPNIVSTSPQVGVTNVDPSLAEITVTFDRDMSPSYSWTGGGPDYPPGAEGKKVHWRDKRTCVKPVALKPGHYYRVGINSDSYKGFQSADGVPIDPTEIYFVTKGATNEVKDKMGRPRIVSTSPKVGATDVDPSLSEITVTFDRDMGGGFSWTGGGPDYPPGAENKKVHWRDKRTCVLPVKLKPGHYYRVGINSDSFRNFSSVHGVAADPSEIYFTTKGATADVKSRTSKPRIVSMNPPNGATDVDPNLKFIRVTFDQPMGRGFSWTGGGPHFPEGRPGKKPRWIKNGTACLLPVKLKPGWDYRLGLNSPSFKNFKSRSGVALDPVVYTFRTRDE